MTHIEDLLARALLVRNRTVPRDTVHHRATTSTRPPTSEPGESRTLSGAAEDLRVLCETLLTHTPPTAVAAFLTDQVPEPRSALALACVLQLADTDEGARFWWQYAAGAGQAAAAYCLYLHHLAQGESDAADWWHRQTDDVQPPPEPPTTHRASAADVPRARHRHPASNTSTATATATILRILRHLSGNTTRHRSATVTGLMTYIPRAVAAGYLREPETELPLPGDGFAQRVQALLATAPTRPEARETTTRSATRDTAGTAPRAMGQARNGDRSLLESSASQAGQHRGLSGPADGRGAGSRSEL